MSFARLQPQIKTLLETITELQEVSEFPKLKYSGFPAACIYPSDNTADYETTVENLRVYAFSVILFYETKEGGIVEAMQALRGLVDSVIDKFDQEDYKGSDSRTIGMNLAVGYTFLNILAHPARWGEIPDEQLLTAEISVKVRISRDIT
jgi:hypothetical protein